MTEEEKKDSFKFIFYGFIIIAVVALAVGLYYYFETFSASPSSYLNNARVPSNPLSHIVYPFYQPLKWWQLPTGATQMTTVQGSGRV